MDSKDLILRELTDKDEEAFFQGLLEWRGEDIAWYTFTWKQGMSYQTMLEILRKEKKGIDLAPNKVPHTMLYAFIEGKIVGRLSVRHELNENLKKRGGHIGYAVAPKFRRSGFATEIFKQGLIHCSFLKLKEILITCGEENIPSCRLIEKFKGALISKEWDENSKEFIRKYSVLVDIEEAFLVKAKRTYEICYPAPLTLEVGDTVEILKSEDKLSEWYGWHFCRDALGREGWISVDFMELKLGQGKINKSYTAEELSALEGQVFKVLDESCGWYWCESEKKEFGWLPQNIFS